MKRTSMTQESNLADGWIYATDIGDGFVDKVTDISQTKDVERQLVLSSTANFTSNPEIKLDFIENNSISKFYLVEGTPFDLNDEEGYGLIRTLLMKKISK